MNFMKLIAPSDFKTTLRKNGTGKTTELAISENSTLADSDWRISIAGDVDDSSFSEFTGFDRCLVLLAGAGMQLHHVSPARHHTTDSLENTLDMAQFDGCNTTTPATWSLPQGHLLQLEAHELSSLLIRGQDCIVTQVSADIS